MFASYALGRISAPIPDGAPTLTKHTIAQMVAPPRIDRSHLPYMPGLDGNDAIGNCTAVAVANTVRAEAVLRGYAPMVAESAATALYGEVTGYDVTRPSSDAGCIETTMLSYQAIHGFKAGAPTEYVGLWANIEPGDLNLVRLAVAHLGVAYIGVDLAMADQAGEGDVWDTGTPASAGDPTPGSWGGHATLIWSYTGLEDVDLVELATWGTLQKATWRWLRSRMDESHALFHPQMWRKGDFAEGVVNSYELAAEVQAFGSMGA
jgi:hypothetical protein